MSIEILNKCYCFYTFIIYIATLMKLLTSLNNMFFCFLSLLLPIGKALYYKMEEFRQCKTLIN